MAEGIKIIEGSLHPFLFMGCWNLEKTVPPALNPRDYVIKAINKDSIKNLILGGDNIYPDKKTDTAGKKIKWYDPGVFTRGIAKIEGKKIYGAIGNHNIADLGILNKEIEYPGWTVGSFYCKIFNDCAIVVIDTNLVEEKFQKQLEFLNKTLLDLRTSSKPYYLIQHEPYASYKKNKTQILIQGDKLLNILKTYPPILILCADTHNYQEGILDIDGTKIKQYVVGTGGAEPDPIGVNTNDITITTNITYTFTSYKSGYGYARIRDISNIEFIHIPIPGSGGMRRTRRTRKRKTKRRSIRK